MAKIVAGVAVAALATAAQAETVGFDRDPAGALPAGLGVRQHRRRCAALGGRGRRGRCQRAQRAETVRVKGAFPWCVKQDTAFADGVVEVKFKPLSGREDQAGGVVWRWKDGDNYYVARANALENNVSLYYTERGSRRTIKYVDAPVPGNAWHTLRVEFKGTRIRVLLDGKAYIELDDSHIAGPGAVGVWTKADSVTAFDDFTYQPAP